MTSVYDLDPHLRKYGSFSLAASADQPGMSYFGDDDGVIAYTELKFGGRVTRICLGEPFAPPELWPRLVRRMIGSSDNLIFMNVGEDFCKVLIKEGMFVDSLGWEAVLELQNYDLTGPKKQNIRNAVRRSAALGYTVGEVAGSDSAWLELDRVSQEWLTRKGRDRPENRLITRPFLRKNRYQRTFGMRDDTGDLVHFITIDELWHEGSVVGYHSNINRGLEDAPKNADYAIHAEIIRTLQSEGIGLLSLGLCPEFGSKPFGKRGNVYSTLALDAARRFGRSIYNLQGITDHKAIFRPTSRRPVYVGTQNPWPLSDLLSVFRACNLI